jgi:hypothetical protein
MFSCLTKLLFITAEREREALEEKRADFAARINVYLK